MKNLLKVLIIHFLFQGLTADLLNIAPNNWNDVVITKDRCMSYCLNEVTPIAIRLTQAKERDANNELKERINYLEQELKSHKLQLIEQETQMTAKDISLRAKDDLLKQCISDPHYKCIRFPLRQSGVETKIGSKVD